MNQKGVALITTMIFLILLTLIGVWAVTQSTTGIKIAASLKRYDLTFNLADGATSVAITYLKNYTPLPSQIWKPTERQEISSEQMPSYMRENTINIKPKYEAIYKPTIEYKGYDTTPLPGWMLNWQGYTAFHRVYYLAKGKGEIPNKAQTVIRALVLKITR